MTVYANLDLDPTCWVGLPPFWGDPFWPDAESWAAEVAASAWSGTGLDHGPSDLDALAAVLVECCHKWGPGAVHAEQKVSPGLEVQTALYLVDPRDVPFPVRVMVADSAMIVGESLSLRDLVEAEDPLAVTPPQVDEIANPVLGAGLVAYRLRAVELEPGQPKDYERPLFALIRYAFPVPGHEDRILVSASWPDIRRLAAAREDIDNLARGITFEYRPDGPT